MTNHYREAQEILEEYANLDGGYQVLNGVRLLLEAQVYATLAIADALRDVPPIGRE